MHADDVHVLTLPPQAAANAEFPLAERLAAARRYLSARGIAQPRPVYGPGSKRPKLTRLLMNAVAARG